MVERYRNPVMASIHETAEGLHAAGVMDQQTLRKFDEACPTPSLEQVAAVSEPAFAAIWDNPVDEAYDAI